MTHSERLQAVILLDVPSGDKHVEPDVDIPPDWRVPANTDIREARWLDAWFAQQLANVTALHIYGKPLQALRPSVRADIRAYADSYTEDSAARYAKILNAVEER